MAALRGVYLGEHQLNEIIFVKNMHYGRGMVHFQELGHTREEIVAKHAPELLPWLLSYLPPATEPVNFPTIEELVARYQRNLEALHALLLARPGGQDHRHAFEYRR